MLIDWNDLIKRRNAWVAANFPGPDMPNTLFGVIEELGELTHAYLKRKQNIRGDYDKHTEDIYDAVGDLTIYLLGVMNHYRYTPSFIVDQSYTEEGAILVVAREVGALANWSHPDLNVYTATSMSIDRILSALVVICYNEDQTDPSDRNWDYPNLVMSVWEKVEQRDWNANPSTGQA